MYHVRPVVSEKQGRQRTGQVLPEVDDAKTVERPYSIT